jgi:microcystin-dependent protein
MDEPFIGQIELFPYTFVPVGYLPCDGKLYAVSQYQALYALIGITYGGSVANQTFAVPNLVGRATVGTGTVAGGIISWTPGHAQGTINETISLSQTPAHTHTLPILRGGSTATAPGNGYALCSTGQYWCAPVSSMNTVLASTALSTAYSGPNEHNNMQPYVVLRPCIAYEGEFPLFN